MDELVARMTRRALLRRGAAGAVGLYAAGAVGAVGNAFGSTKVKAGGVTLNWLTWSDHYFPNQLQAVQKAVGIGARPQLFSDDSDSYVKV